MRVPVLLALVMWSLRIAAAEPAPPLRLTAKEAKAEGTWTEETDTPGSTTEANGASLRFRPRFPAAGFYRLLVRGSFTPENERAQLGVTVGHAFSVDRTQVRQLQASGELGVHYFREGTSGHIELRLEGSGTLSVESLALELVPEAEVAPAWDGKGPRFRLPEGLSIRSAITPGLSQYPMCAGLDLEGRLYVCESSGRNMPGKERVTRRECLVRRLEDRDRDGVYERATVFADELSLPMGVLAHEGAVWVASAPDFIRLVDEDDDGVADRREVILSGFQVFNTASLHGPFLSPAGEIFLTHGRHGYRLDTPTGPVEGLAARIWRVSPDGRRVERYAGGGFDNPVELAFTKTGEIFSTMTYITNPRDGMRDALLHVVEGGVYPKEHAVVKEFPWTGGFLPPATRWGRVAPAGLLRIRGTELDESYRGNLFAVWFNAGKVIRQNLVPEGSSYRTEDEVFLSSPDPDFHPTDILEDADGSLLLLDTGGWYLQACPLSRHAKPDLRGGIYRIERADLERLEDARGLAVDLMDLPPSGLTFWLVSDPRPAYRDRVLAELVRRGDAAIDALAFFLSESKFTARQRRRCVFALARLGTESAGKALLEALDDAASEVRHAALRPLAWRGVRAAAPKLLELIPKAPLAEKRAAIEALGQLGDAGSAPLLFDQLAPRLDPFLEHTIIFALARLASRAELRARSRAPHPPPVRRAALLALEIRARDDATAAPRREDVLAALALGEPRLEAAALRSLEARPAWRREVSPWIAELLERDDPKGRAILEGALLAFASEPSVQELAARSLLHTETSRDLRIALLEILARAPVDPFPTAWTEPLRKSLGHPELAVARQALAVVRRRGLEGFEPSLEGMARNPRFAAEARRAAIHALALTRPKLPEDLLALLLGGLDPTVPLLERRTAAEALTCVMLPPAREADWVARLATLDALSAGALAPRIARLSDPALRLRALEALARPELARSLPIEKLAALWPEASARVASARDQLVTRRRAGRGQEATRLARLLEETKDGDRTRGRALFFGPRAACGACHRAEGGGGVVGPDLSGLGALRARRDFLESIVYPSSTFAQGYESLEVVTRRGQVHSGVPLESAGDELELRLADGARLRLPRRDIVSTADSEHSLMPSGYAELLSRGELADLLEYLGSLTAIATD